MMLVDKLDCHLMTVTGKATPSATKEEKKQPSYKKKSLLAKGNLMNKHHRNSSSVLKGSHHLGVGNFDLMSKHSSHSSINFKHLK